MSILAATSATPMAPTYPIGASRPQPPEGDHPAEGLYGPRGWSVRVGLWHLLAQWPDPARSIGLAPTGRPGPTLIDEVGSPVSDYVPFQGLDAATSRRLLGILPGAALGDRQNLAPTLRSMLAACAGADGQVRLSGYAIGPQRHDERMSAEALWVADPDLLEVRVDPKHRGECQCDLLWARVSQRYDLDALSMPDEILRTRPEWAGGAQGWWLWWD